MATQIDVDKDITNMIRQLLGVKPGVNLQIQLASTYEKGMLNANTTYLAQSKIDGIRVSCFMFIEPDGEISIEILTRQFKSVPNYYIRKTLEDFMKCHFTDGLVRSYNQGLIKDGDFGAVLVEAEIKTLSCIHGAWVDDKIQDVQSKVMKERGTHNFHICPFDYISRNYTNHITVEFENLENGKNDTVEGKFLEDCSHETSYHERYAQLRSHVVRYNRNSGMKKLLTLPRTEVLRYDSSEELNDAIYDLMRKMVSLGYEGLVIRSPEAYKPGRPDKRHQLLRLKPVETIDVKIVDTISLKKNNNEAKDNGTGSSKRRTLKENMIDTELLGALVVISDEGVIFNVGSGFSDVQRKELWEVRKELIGKTIAIEHINTGVGNKSRNPVFLYFREDK
jgi:DNA ligase OB-like domain